MRISMDDMTNEWKQAVWEDKDVGKEHLALIKNSYKKRAGRKRGGRGPRDSTQKGRRTRGKKIPRTGREDDFGKVLRLE